MMIIWTEMQMRNEMNANRPSKTIKVIKHHDMSVTMNNNDHNLHAHIDHFTLKCDGIEKKRERIREKKR